MLFVGQEEREEEGEGRAPGCRWHACLSGRTYLAPPVVGSLGKKEAIYLLGRENSGLRLGIDMPVRHGCAHTACTWLSAMLL